MSFWKNLFSKANPAQEQIYYTEGTNIPSSTSIKYHKAFEALESVNRGTNMVVSACASLDYDVKETVSEAKYPGIRQKSLIKLLNYRPNPYQSVQDFRTNIFTDFILEGNVFIYYDGAFMYHLPASEVEIIPDTKTFVNSYIYGKDTVFKAEEIIHFKDLSCNSIYRGDSRLRAAQTNIDTLYKMQSFQGQFFENGAVPGMALFTENTLSAQAKEKTIALWMKSYNPKSGGKKPIIVDSGLKPIPLGTTNFKELDFD